MNQPCIARWLGLQNYQETIDRMMVFTDERQSDTPDEIWFLEHPPIFTKGTSCKVEPHKNPDRIPIIQSNRGGQMSYHAPGQLIAYLLFDIKRLNLGPKALVQKTEQSIINVLKQYKLNPERREKAPGVYIQGEKIAALGLRIRNGKCFHGLSLNVNMNLVPFQWIDPCGESDLVNTQLNEGKLIFSIQEVMGLLVKSLEEEFFLKNGISYLQNYSLN